MIFLSREDGRTIAVQASETSEGYLDGRVELANDDELFGDRVSNLADGVYYDDGEFVGPLSEYISMLDYDLEERDFDESKHPRDEHGQWTDAGGGDGGNVFEHADNLPKNDPAQTVVAAVRSGQTFYHGTARADLPFRQGAVAYFALNRSAAQSFADMDAGVEGGKPVVLAATLSGAKVAALDSMLMQDLHTPENRAGVVSNLLSQGFDAAVGRGNASEIAVINPSVIKPVAEEKWTFAGGPHGEKWQAMIEQVAEVWHDAHSLVHDKTVELTHDINTVMLTASNYTDWKDWYAEAKQTAEKLFGKEYAPVFEQFIAATSINTPVKQNVRLALRAMAHWLGQGKFDKSFTGTTDLARHQLAAVVAGLGVHGPKVEAFSANLQGDLDQATIDRWMKVLLFAHPTMSGGKSGLPQSLAGQAIVKAMADKMGWKTAQLQACLWAATMIMHGEYPTKLTEHLASQESMAMVTKIQALIATQRDLAKRDATDDPLDVLEQASEAYWDAALLFEYIAAIKETFPEIMEVKGYNGEDQRDFDESKHPRDEHGRWTDGGGSDGDGGIEDHLNPTGPDRADLPEDSIKHAIRETKNWFPDVPAKDIKIDDGENGDYNCIGWAVGDPSRWWWPGHQGSGFYWPNDDSPYIAAFDHLLKDEAHAVEIPVDDQQPEKGFVKLALYSHDEDAKDNPNAYPSHLARQLSNGEWSSKMGWSYLVRHGNDIKATDGAEYGDLVKIYKVPEADWKRLRTL